MGLTSGEGWKLAIIKNETERRIGNYQRLRLETGIDNYLEEHVIDELHPDTERQYVCFLGVYINEIGGFPGNKLMQRIYRNIEKPDLIERIEKDSGIPFEREE